MREFRHFLEDVYGIQTEIQEPRGFMDIVEVLKRDFKVHGVFFRLTDGDLKLGFTCDAKTILESEYQLNGTMGYYKYILEDRPNDYADWTELFSGLVDFGTRSYDENYILFEVSNSQEQIELSSRLKQKINLNKTKDLDGNAVNNIHGQDLMSLATRLSETLDIDQDDLVVSQQSAAQASNTSMRGTGEWNVFASKEIEDFNNPVARFYDINTVDSFPEPFLILQKESALILKMSWDFDIDLTEDQGGGTTSYSLTLAVVSSKPNDQGESSWVIYTSSPSSASPYNFSDTDTTNNHSVLGLYDGIFEPGTEFRLQWLITMGGTGTQQFTAQWTVRELHFEWYDVGANETTVAHWYQVHDVLNKILQLITGNQDFLYSDVLGDLERGYAADGCLGTMNITNGYRLRQINTASRAPSLSFNDIIENLNAIHQIGYGFEEILSPYQLGFFDLEIYGWYSPDLAIIFPGNVTYEIVEGETIHFYNNPVLYGGWPITLVVYDPINDQTIVYIDASESETWFFTNNFDFGSEPEIGTLYEDVYVTCTSVQTTRERLRVEPWEHFYQDAQLIDLGTVQSYEEIPFKEEIFSGIEIRFKKYANDEDKPETLEDIHTESDWSTPINNVKKKLQIGLSWIGSVFMMNESRDTLFSEKPTTSHKLDDDIFFCDRVKWEGDFYCTFDGVANTITVPKVCWDNYMSQSNFFTITGTASNDADHTWDSNSAITKNTYAETVKVEHGALGTPYVTESSVLCHFVFWTSIWQPFGMKVEADENMTNTVGITNPQYFANQRRTQKRFLERWSGYINSFLSYLTDGVNQTIRNTRYVNNGEYQGSIDPYAGAEVCQEGTSLEKDDIESSAMDSAKFRPNLIKCKTHICDEDFQTILDAHKNKLPSLNYGYFTLTTPKAGETKQGWLLEMKRSPIDKITELTLLELFRDGGGGGFEYTLEAAGN